MSQADRKLRAIQRLLRPVDEDNVEDYNEDDAGVGLKPSRRNDAKPDQIRFYIGEELELLKDARDRMRLFLFTVLPFATVDALTEHAKIFYVGACQDLYKSRYKGICYFVVAF